MPERPVLHYPERILKQPTEAVDEIGPDERALAEDLVDTMRASPGCVGVAAPQIGVPVRAFALDVSVMKRPPQGNHGLVVFFDPTVVTRAGSELAREGCLSVPDYTCDVRRAETVIVRGREPDGEERVIEAHGFEARAFQHELDHLEGVIILDRVASARTDIHPRRRYAGRGEHLR